MAVGATSRIRRWAAIIAGLALLALAVAACDPGAPAPAGPPGPVTPAPTATLAPTETPISIGGAGGALYQQAHAAMIQLKSYQFVSDTDLGKAASQHIDGVWVAPNITHLTVVTKGTAQEGTQQICRVADREWSRPNDATGWTQVSNPPSTTTSPDQTAAILRYAQALDKAEDTTLTIDGQPVAVTRLTFTLDAGQLATANVGIAKGSGELWIDRATKRIVRMKMTFTSSVTAARGEATTTITLSKFDDAGNAANCPS